MKSFRWKEWWRYRRAALSRHGVHSPFVYRFFEEALRPKLPADLREAFREAALSRYQFGQFATLYRCAKFLSDESPSRERACFDFAKDEVEAAGKMDLLREGIGLIVPGIHESPEKATLWQKLCADERANLSIDLWYLGLLLFREDFKVKQHFILRVAE